MEINNSEIFWITTELSLDEISDDDSDIKEYIDSYFSEENFSNMKVVEVFPKEDEPEVINPITITDEVKPGESCCSKVLQFFKFLIT
ncbi:hypothetical protein [Carp edema virus]|nr:hypothetical protein [Carp edema virus]